MIAIIIIVIIIMEGKEDLVEEGGEIHLKMVTIITREMTMKIMNGTFGLLFLRLGFPPLL
jgi:hypothetical protein